MSMKNQLLSGEKAVAFWGLGYIGYSALVYYAHKGVRVVGYDISPEVVANLKAGKSPASGLDTWLKMNGMGTEVRGTFTNSVDEIAAMKDDIVCFKLAIPTEKNDHVSDGFLRATCLTLAAILDGRTEEVLIDIESTVAPRMIDDVVVPAFKNVPGARISSSPRRDWFISSEKDLSRLPRIVGGTTPEAGKLAVEVNSIVCHDVVQASTHREAAATKAVENALRNVSINVVNQMARDVDLDVREVCDLVATKWNVGRYNPSLGIGGYCIPLGPAYLMDGNSNDKLGLLRAAVDETVKHIHWVSQRIIEDGVKSVAVVGLSYRGDVPVYKMSPPVWIARDLSEAGIAVRISDHYATDTQMVQIMDGRKEGAATVVIAPTFTQAMRGAELVIIGAYHGAYSSTPMPDLLRVLDKCKWIIDNEGALAHVPAHVWEENGISYRRPGQRGWARFER